MDEMIITDHGMNLRRQLEAEEQMRSDLYAVLSRLFFLPPDAEILRSLAESEPLGGDSRTSALPEAWRRLSNAANVATHREEAIYAEYEALFGSDDNAQVSLFGSSYATDAAPDKLLTQLRRDMTKLGLDLSGDNGELEDHIAALTEAMRRLLYVDELPSVRHERQKKFFGKYLRPWYGKLATAIDSAPEANFYKPVAGLMQAFFDLERIILRIDGL